MTSINPFEFQIEIAAQDSTAEDIDKMARQLLVELRDIDLVETVSLVKSGYTPSGAKSIDPVTIGALAVAVLPSVLPKVIEAIQAWALRGQGKTVKFKGKINGEMIEFEGATEELKKLMRQIEKGKKKK